MVFGGALLMGKSDRSNAHGRLLLLRIRLGTCEQRLHFFRGCILHVRQHVRINIECEGNACMSKLLADDLRRHACGQCQCGGPVSQVVKADVRQSSLFK